MKDITFNAYCNVCRAEEKRDGGVYLGAIKAGKILHERCYTYCTMKDIAYSKEN